MSLEDSARSELLTMRKQTDGVTPGAMARTSTLLHVLGGGDPLVAYNALKHAVLSMDSSLQVAAATYSLGFASEGDTHLDRLTDFGTDYGYDQRQARRYSDKGIDEIAQYVASQWTIESSPKLELQVLAISDHGIELLILTEFDPFTDMRTPIVQSVKQDGTRNDIPCDWLDQSDDINKRGITHISVGAQTDSQHVTILWNGELWPRFSVLARVGLPIGFTVSSLGARLSIWAPVEAGQLIDNSDTIK